MSRPAASVRIGTRGSALALAQAGIVRDSLAGIGIAAEIRIVVTEGDRRAPDTAWGEGAFVNAIETVLLSGQVDLAVHSAKDVPTEEDPRLVIAAFLPRADPRDVVVLPVGASARSLDDLPPAARVGTDSPRRTAFLRAARPDLRIHPLHGNVDTRLRRLDDGETDALVLAAAGLARLGRMERVALTLEPTVVPPAPGQGGLALQVRADDGPTLEAVRHLDDAATRLAIETERNLLAASGGGCRAPLGALAEVRGDRLRLLGGYARTEGDVAATAVREAHSEEASGLVDALLGELAWRAAAAALAAGRPTVIVARPALQVAATMLALIDAGFAPVSVPAIEIELQADGPLAAATARLEAFDWVVLTSPNAVRALREAAALTGTDLRGIGTAGTPRWGVVGRTTERALAATGIRADVRPAGERAAALADALPPLAGARILLPRSDLADDDLPSRLRERGAVVEGVVAYRTREAPEGSLDALREVLVGGPAAVVLGSPSTVRGYLALASRLGAAQTAHARSIRVIAYGPRTAAAAVEHGLDVVAEATGRGPADIRAAATRALPIPVETR